MAFGRHGTDPLIASTRLLPFVACLLVLSACQTSGQPENFSRERSVALEDAYVAAPVGGPELLSVVEERYPNATQQRIVLANRSAVSGSNYLQVQFFGPVGNSGTGRSPLPNRSIASTDMSRELRTVFPTVPMRRSQLYVQNRYGPFGYAVGRSASGDTCVYAWQRIAGVDTSTLLLRDRGTIQLRFRLCDQTADEQTLLYAMYGFSIRAYFSSLHWNPYGSPPVADPRLGALGEPIVPEGARGFETVIPDEAPAREAPATAPRRPASRTPAAAPLVTIGPPLPAPIGPVVPLPPAGTSTSRPLTTGAAVPIVQAPSVPAPVSSAPTQAQPSAAAPTRPATEGIANVPGASAQSPAVDIGVPAPPSCTSRERAGGVC